MSYRGKLAPGAVLTRVRLRAINPFGGFMPDRARLERAIGVEPTTSTLALLRCYR
jgi:hypothetical protein